MARVLSSYEIAWRKSAGHPVDDDAELERLTAPAPREDAPVAVLAPPPVAAPAAPAKAPEPVKKK